MTEVKTVLQVACLGALLIVLIIAGVTLYRFNIVLEDFRSSFIFQAASSFGYSSLESLVSNNVQEEIQDSSPLEEGSQPVDAIQDNMGLDDLEIPGIDDSGAEQDPEEYEPVEESEATPQVVEVDTGNICNRTPEIQQRLIEMLQITSCREITGEELVRVRHLELGRMPLKVGDLDGFISLTSLTLLAEEAPVGLFDELVSLEYLELGLEAPPSPGLFRNLATLQQMELFVGAQDDAEDLALQGVFEGLNALMHLELEVSARSEDYSIPLVQGSLTGMPNLQTLEISNVSRVEAGVLDGLPALRSANLRAINLPDHLSKPSLPPDVFAGNPDLERVGFSGFRDVPRLDFNSLNVICRMQSNMDLRYGVGFEAVVQQEVVEVVDYDWDDDNLACTLRVAPVGTENWQEVRVNVQALPESRRR